MKVLRDVRETTKLLMLQELTAHRHSRLRTIADRLDITVQAVSEYMKMMTREGLVRKVEGEWRATRRGVEFLQANFVALRDFVESSMREMSIVDVCAAIAGGSVREGESVGLFMEKGELVAYPGRNSSSRGVVIHNAVKGEDVGVKDLEGIVQLHPGKITMLRIPSVQEGGARKLDVRKVKKAVRLLRFDIVAAVDLVGRVLAERLTLDPRITFGALPATLEAAQEGLDVLVLCQEDRVAEFISEIEDCNTKLEEKVAYETVNVR